MIRLRFVWLIFTGLFFSGLIFFQEVHAQTSPVKYIPEFTFHNLNGQNFTRSELKKNKKLIIILFDVNCDHCQNEIAAIGDRINEFKNAEFYMVSMNDVPEIEKFMNNYGEKLNGRANVKVLHDFYKQFVNRFLPIQFPALYVYNSDFRLVKYFGQNSDIHELIRTINNP